MAGTTREATERAASGGGRRSRAGAGRWRWFVAGLAVGIVALAVGGVLVGGPLTLAHRNDLPLEQAYGDGAVGLAARLNAGNAQNPLAGDPRAVAAGSMAFAGSCSVCHGAGGAGRAFSARRHTRQPRCSPATTRRRRATPSCSGSLRTG